MAMRLKKRQALLAKIEVTYGTDPVPVGGTDAMYIYNLNINPLDVQRSERQPVRPFFGADSPALGGSPVKVEFQVPIAGGGAAATPPGYASLLKACYRSETIAADVTYALLSSGTMPSVTLYVNVDGVLQKVTGCRGKAAVEFAHNAIPMYKFTFTGIYAAPTDTALPSLTFGATWPKPLLQNKVNTTFTIHGFSAVLSKFQYDDGVAIQWKDFVNNTEEVRVTDRPKVSGSCSIQADTVAAKDWQTIAKAGTLAAISLVHGVSAGNKWQFDAANVMIVNPDYEDDGGVLMYKLGLEFYPTSAGNNEFTEKTL